MKKLLAVAGIVSLMSGCAVNPYEKYYTPNPAATGLVHPTGADPEIVESSGNLNDDVAKMFGDGYGAIGNSHFNGPEYQRRLLIDEAKKIGATKVLVFEKFTETEHGAAPVVLPSFASIVGSVGRTAVSSSIVGTTTTMVPTNVRRFDQIAIYWAPAPHGILDVQAQDLTPEQRAKFDTNKGVVIKYLRKHGPAFEADLLAGDMVKSIGGEEVEDMQTFAKILERHADQTVTFVVVRDGKKLEKAVKLNPMPTGYDKQYHG